METITVHIIIVIFIIVTTITIVVNMIFNIYYQPQGLHENKVSRSYFSNNYISFMKIQLYRKVEKFTHIIGKLDSLKSGPKIAHFPWMATYLHLSLDISH